MLLALILSIILFLLSFIFLVLLTIGSFSKRTTFLRMSFLFLLIMYIGVFFMFAMELLGLHIIATDDLAWGWGYFFIVCQLLFLLVFYGLLVDNFIFCENCIYQITYFLTFKRRSYDDVKHYKQKVTHEMMKRSRFRDPEPVTDCTLDVFFKDGKSKMIMGDDEHDKRIVYIKKLLGEKAQRNNSRRSQKKDA